MISHHPSKGMLLEHSAGTLSWTTSIAITAHLQMCLQCRQELHHLNGIGGALLETASPRRADPHIFKRVMANIDKQSDEPSATGPASPEVTQVKAAATGSKSGPARNHTAAFDPAPNERKRDARPDEENSSVAGPSRSTYGCIASSDLPPVIRSLMPDFGAPRWRAPAPSVRVADLATGPKGERVALLEFARGTAMPAHSHKGRELTLVLDGHFSDSSGLYLPGDLLIKEAEQTHRPVATMDRPCLCLYISEGPMAPMHQVAALADKLLSSLPFNKFQRSTSLQP